MAEHKINPKIGEVWVHPDTFNSYRIHSLTDDGWVRYYPNVTKWSVQFYFTQPTLRFIQTYNKSEEI